MRLIFFLLRASWRVALLAALIGAASGGASAALVAVISRSLEQADPSSTFLIGLFAALCLVILLTRIASHILLFRLTANSTSKLRLGLCERILQSPLRHLEEIGEHRMLASLTNGRASKVSKPAVIVTPRLSKRWRSCWRPRSRPALTEPTLQPSSSAASSRL